MCNGQSRKKDSHRPDTTVSLTGTSLCTYAIEPPCTERYARWCERSGLVSPSYSIPVYPPARRELAAHGIGCQGHHARQVTVEDYRHYDRIYYMDASNKRYLDRMLPMDDDKIRPLLPRDVADPWYTGDFTKTWEDLVEGCQKIMEEFA